MAFATIILYGGLTGSHAMWVFLQAWLIAMVVRRLAANRMRAGGWRTHSRYDGRPWLAIRLPRARTEGEAKEVGEPLLCVAAGAGAAFASPHLGLFLAVGFLSVGFKAAIERWAFEARVRAMQDAEIEHRQLADSFRDRRDGR